MVAIPFYRIVRDEVEIFKAAWKSRHAVVLKGPTGCGKTRFAESMAAELGRPLITVSCHEDLSAADLLGRYLLKGWGNRLDGRTVDSRRPPGGDLLSRRNRRSACRYHSGDSRADGLSPRASCGEAG